VLDLNVQAVAVKPVHDELDAVLIHCLIARASTRIDSIRARTRICEIWTCKICELAVTKVDRR
jgi:hypothetical protein